LDIKVLTLEVKSVEELTALLQEAKIFSDCLQKKRNYEFGTHGQNMAVYICQKLGVFGYSKMRK